ncbi:MAG: hypothetical protein IJR91_01925 [Ruminococcus sp.]|nr:hypothetical protein [Ruminococcus sp.]
MKFKYVRIQGKELAINTKYAKGIFSMFQKLIRDGVMEQEDADLFQEIDLWFSEVLPYPPHCMRRENVVCFFKTENTEFMMKMMKPLMWLLERYGQQYFVVYTNTPGEIVYEDEYQVVVKAGFDPVYDEMLPSWTPEEKLKELDESENDT